jgi:hypothetical protein
MSTFDAANSYFSGQGVVMLGVKNAVTGAIQYYEPIGNVSELKVNIATSVQDHKSSQDGQRAIDKRIQTETKASASMTIDNWIAKNLAKALRGDTVSVPAATGLTETVDGYRGKVVALSKIKLSNLVLTKGSALTAYTNDATPYDYKVNLEAGSFQLNPGTVVAPAAAGSSISATAIVVGATTTFTVANTLAVGDVVAITGVTGADAGLVNGKEWTVLTATGANFSIDLNSTGKTLTFTGNKIALPVVTSIVATYDVAAQFLVNALTQPLSEIAVRFEGLNTADGNNPVIVELFKFAIDPLKELSLLSDTFGTFQIEGALLADSSRTSGSKYFSVKKLN